MLQQMLSPAAKAIRDIMLLEKFIIFVWPVAFVMLNPRKKHKGCCPERACSRTKKKKKKKKKKISPFTPVFYKTFCAPREPLYKNEKTKLNLKKKQKKKQTNNMQQKE
eukprot:TRINITY_DN60493_c0_g1_i1.p4 TRINITY_DN60493_c0_g1~~TRINITY_DN60493_c0_g1_i1.p4  ORF type:complete len:108 (-),score=25.34 TRINITY_DN60493_c0_g1_i1:63-386(-)